MVKEVKGFEQPRLFPPPLRPLTLETSKGFETIEFAEQLGIRLYPWQKWLLVHGLELNEDLTDFRFKRVIVEVARQNGKTTLMTVLGLWRLFIFGASEIVSSAQKLTVAEATLEDAFKIAAWQPVLRGFLPDDPRPKDGRFNGAWMRETNGNKQIELNAAPVPEKLDVFGALPTWSVTTADRKGGRSSSVDLAFIDELRELLTWDGWNSIEPTISARRESQLWGFSNAGDKRSIVLKSLRDAAIERIELGSTDGMQTALFSWSAPSDAEVTDVDALRQANPSMGYGAITLDKLLAEAEETKNPDGFKTEKMCVWVENLEPGKIPVAAWREIADPSSVRGAGERVAVGVDVSKDGRFAYVAVCALRADGIPHVEVVAQRAGYAWVAEWLRQRLAAAWFDGRVAIQVKGAPSADLVPALQAVEGVEIVEWQGSAMSSSVLGFFDAIRSGMLAHRDQPVLNLAAEGAKDKKAGDLFIWDRQNSVGDVSPLIAANIAWWHLTHEPEEKFVSAYAADYYDDDLIDAADYDDDDDYLLIV